MIRSTGLSSQLFGSIEATNSTRRPSNTTVQENQNARVNQGRESTEQNIANNAAWRANREADRRQLEDDTSNIARKFYNKDEYSKYVTIKNLVKNKLELPNSQNLIEELNDLTEYVEQQIYNIARNLAIHFRNPRNSESDVEKTECYNKQFKMELNQACERLMTLMEQAKKVNSNQTTRPRPNG